MDRRQFPRIAVSCPVVLEVELLGSEFLVEGFDSSGIVLNISRSGMLAEVDRLLSAGTDCVVSVVRPNGVVEPRQFRGHVRRSSVGRAGWVIGVEFEALVDVRDTARETKPSGSDRGLGGL